MKKLISRHLANVNTIVRSALSTTQTNVVAPGRNEYAAVLHGTGASTSSFKTHRNKQFYFAKLTALVGVVLTTCMIGGWLFFFASDQFVVETRFAARANEQRMAETIGALAGIPAVSNTADSNLLVDYVRSTDIVREIDKSLNLRDMFGAKGDWYFRVSKDATLEDLVHYWRNMVGARVESSSQSVVVSVRAFSAKDAIALATLITQKCEHLVNQLSEKAREEALASSTREVKQAENRLMKARDEARLYRDKSQVMDPRGAVEARSKLVGQMEAELTALRSEMRSLRSFLADNAPSMISLRTRISAMEAELTRVKASVENSTQQQPGRGLAESNAAGNSLPNVIQKFENLQTEALFAEKAYLASMAALERSRAEADRNSKYLAVHVRPVEPESATQPKRFLLTLSTFVISLLLWGVGWLFYLGIRDHMH